MIDNSDNQSSTQKAFGEALAKLGNKYKNFVVLSSNLSDSSLINSFERAFPDRYFNFGNGIENMVGSACGFTVRGKLPIVFSYASQITGKCWEQIRSYISYPNLNVKIVGLKSGLLNGQEGALFQSFEDVSLMRSIFNMKVICPSDSVQVRKITEEILQDYGPTYIRLTHISVPDLYDEKSIFEIGKGRIYKPGTDLCIFTYGVSLHMAFEAAQILERQGISTMVVDLFSIKPLDENLITECAKFVGHVVTVEDHSTTGGLGSAVCEILSKIYPCKVLCLGMDGFGESGKVDDLFRKYKLDPVGIAEHISELIIKN